MALVNDAKKEINAKIVYIGQAAAGKGTALRSIYSRLKPESRSELKSMAVGEHQMLFFDFSYPATQLTGGYTVRFHIYTLIAGGDSLPPWKMLLKGVDGVVLLADSTDGRMYGNLESCATLFDAIAHFDRKISDIALSLQCNKRDLKGALSLDQIGAELLPDHDSDPLPVTATEGKGLLEGLDSLIRNVLDHLGYAAPTQSLSVAPLPEYGRAGAAAVEAETEEAYDHCNEDNPEFTVETAGEPVLLDGSTVVIPLRLKGAACGKSAEFKVTVSVSM